MKRKLYALLIVSGLVILTGITGSDDLYMELEQVGRPLWQLISTAITGGVLMAMGIIGVNRKGGKANDRERTDCMRPR